MKDSNKAAFKGQPFYLVPGPKVEGEFVVRLANLAWKPGNGQPRYLEKTVKKVGEYPPGFLKPGLRVGVLIGNIESTAKTAYEFEDPNNNDEKGNPIKRKVIRSEGYLWAESSVGNIQGKHFWSARMSGGPTLTARDKKLKSGWELLEERLKEWADNKAQFDMLIISGHAGGVRDRCAIRMNSVPTGGGINLWASFDQKTIQTHPRSKEIIKLIQKIVPKGGVIVFAGCNCGRDADAVQTWANLLGRAVAAAKGDSYTMHDDDDATGLGGWSEGGYVLKEPTK